jgi:hypothetical protein
MMGHFPSTFNNVFLVQLWDAGRNDGALFHVFLHQCVFVLANVYVGNNNCHETNPSITKAWIQSLTTIAHRRNASPIRSIL